MPDVLDWREGEEATIATRAAAALAAGRLAALPTESTYEAAAAALDADAVHQLHTITAEPLALVVTSAAEAFDWLPQLRGPGARLVRKVGPGPWLLQAEGAADRGLVARLPEAVRGLLLDGQHLTLRWPAHSSWAATARTLGRPLVSAALPATTAEAVADSIDLVVNAGPTPLGVPPTLIRATSRLCEVRREGGLPAAEITEAARCRVLFVCTGNTCRSPMAEALCTRLLADRLGCRPDELTARGFVVQSAGLAAQAGAAASEEAVGVAGGLGGDLSGHRSQPLSYDLYTQADFVFTMTASHLYALQGARIPEGPTPDLLSPAGEDVADPIGGERAVYQACADEILAHLRRRVPAILEA